LSNRTAIGDRRLDAIVASSFVGCTTTKTGPPAFNSFRSLVLDHQDYYTGACATLLTNDNTRPDIQTLLRQQLEELFMDEAEHEALAMEG
jgi:hypothetical protein